MWSEAKEVWKEINWDKFLVIEGLNLRVNRRGRDEISRM
jgi:hypothetical protein